MHLRRDTQEVYYFKQNQEVDFYAKLEKEYLINISYDISSPQTLNCEITSLQEGMKYFNLNQSFLITADKEELIKQDDKTIKILPVLANT